jgi:hypothetical protein
MASGARSREAGPLQLSIAKYQPEINWRAIVEAG